MTTPTDYNLLGLDEDTLRDPYPFYRLLQRDAPVYQEPEYGVYLVSRYADVLEIVRQPDRFSNRMATGPTGRLRVDRLPPDVREVVEKMAARGTSPLSAITSPGARDGSLARPTLLAADAPEHDRYRGICNQLLNSRRVRQWEPRIRQIASELVDAFIGADEVELVGAFAHPLPLRVVAELLGVPPGDTDRLDVMFGGPNAGEAIGNPNVVVTRVVRAMIARGEPPGGPPTGPAADLFTSFFSERIARLRAAPVPGDFLSDLIQVRDDAGALSDEELLSIIRHFRVAGHETSTKMITAAMYNLIVRPDVMEAARRDLSLCANLVEEALRIESPVQALFRVANEACRVGDVEVPAGALLMMLYGAANHDPDQFPRPETFDPDRPNARAHLAFGQGPHYCLGAGFARAEGRIALEVLLSRTKEIKFVEDRNSFERTASYVLRGLRELYVHMS